MESDDEGGERIPVRKGKDWEPPKGSWEGEVLHIDCIEEEYDEKLQENKRVGFVMWTNGKKSKHSLKILNSKCPQKLLQYYEQHL
jgi:chromobox protein 1